MTKTREFTAEDLFPLVQEFINPQSELVDPRDPRSEKVTSPALWDQLIDNTARSGGLDGGSVQRSRPPVATGVLSLVTTIRKACADQLLRIGRKPIWQHRTVSDRDCEHFHPRPDSTIVETWRDVPAELRAISASTKLSDNARIAWAEQVSNWITQAKAALGQTIPRIQLPRGTKCMDCGTAWRTVVEDGEDVRKPAVRLVWHDNGTLYYVACDACGKSRWPYDLHALAEHQAQVNLEQETLTIPDTPQSIDNVADSIVQPLS